MARILVIDDEKPIGYLLRRVLESDGHDVEEAEDGQQGLEAYHAHPPDLTIVDIMMPVMDGHRFIEKLLPDYPDAKIVATAAVGQWVLEKAESLGAVGSFLKPFDVDEVRQLVKSVLAGESPAGD